MIGFALVLMIFGLIYFLTDKYNAFLVWTGGILFILGAMLLGLALLFSPRAQYPFLGDRADIGIFRRAQEEYALRGHLPVGNGFPPTKVSNDGK